MKKLIWVAIPIVIIALIFSLGDSETSQSYLEEVTKEIEGRKRYLEFSDESPFNQYDIEYSSPLYFEIKPEYKVNARVERFENREIVMLGTSSGKTQRYLKFAWLHFDLLGTTQKLLVLKPVGFNASETLFCAFSDDSSGETTYGGGRYLDVEIGKSNKTVIDFNLAYNPYCAYASEYSCPLPPAANILPINILAGEKAYPSH